MADTGRTVFADGLWADGFFAVGLWAADEPVAVPDVDDPGTSQAAAIALIEGATLVAAVVTAYSSTIPAGEVISQDPAAGTLVPPGSTVTITVSLGEAPAQDSGGGGFWHAYDHVAHERRRRKREEEERAAEAQQIQDDLDRQIAQLMREQEAKDADKADLQRLQKLADAHAGKKLGLPKKVSDALINAYEARTRNALEQLRREIEQAETEELLAVQTAVLFLLD
jgi:hypothetical protein